MLAARKIIFKYYTMVEILVVLTVVGILLGISTAGINGMLKRQGASGAVRSISSKISLARSYATVKNAYVALLLPNDNPTPPGDPSVGKYNTGFSINDSLKHFLYAQNRLCLVTPSVINTGDYTFDSWIDGNEWDNLPSGTCAYISANPVRVDSLTINAGGTDYTSRTSSAIVFKPNGMLANGSSVLIKVFMARYILTVSGGNLVYETKSGQNKAWEISINPFTGKASYEKKSY